MDSLKAKVAAMVRNAVTSEFRYRDIDGVIESASVSIITDLQTSVRLRTPEGVRYFIVQVKESY